MASSDGASQAEQLTLRNQEKDVHIQTSTGSPANQNPPSPVHRRSQDGNGGTSKFVGKLTKEKKSPIAAAAADREIALAAWMASADRDDEVRDALGRMMGWVEELAALLHTNMKEKKEIETNLRVTESNLALALSNTEMLEDALRRDASGRRADVGWTRSTATSSPLPTSPPIFANSSSGQGANPSMPKSETGFFKFLKTNTSTASPAAHHLHRDSAGSAGMHSANSSMDAPAGSASHHARPQSQLMSPSLPSLHSTTTPSRREDELTHALQRERASTSKVLKEKQQLEEELESLSQALFEEANRMVATERKQRAQVEEDLQNARQEREALKGALKIIETENATLRARHGQNETQPSPITVAIDQQDSVPRDRARALTIDTDRAGAHSGVLSEVPVSVTQTPSTSGVPYRVRGERTPESASQQRDNFNKGHEETGVGGARIRTESSSSRRSSVEPTNSQDRNVSYVPRGSLSFGM